uniref:Uncharacterized protein n=1 Tax=Romanomermis culicivorax TaxID=13658 RepID=A0A915L3F0_ROMCU
MQSGVPTAVLSCIVPRGFDANDPISALVHIAYTYAVYTLHVRELYSPKGGRAPQAKVHFDKVYLGNFCVKSDIAKDCHRFSNAKQRDPRLLRHHKTDQHISTIYKNLDVQNSEKSRGSQLSFSKGQPGVSRVSVEGFTNPPYVHQWLVVCQLFKQTKIAKSVLFNL